ncbi:unnamed protein product [Mytilus edulis]|uniref:CARD domain-containing protein n=1 Tax=Mytilus edulis TaxID=6550 RepID=A0A8S3QH18_MYTED|nr:unnamed protein product [Mytilus edulis]
MTPVAASHKEHENKLYWNLYGSIPPMKPPRFRAGDKVRITKKKDIKDDSVRLQKCYKIIVDDLDSIEPIDKLVEFDVLSPEHMEELKACRTPRETNRKLLRTLMFKFKDGYQNFLDSLKDDCVHEDLAEKIMQTEVTEKDRHLLRIESYNRREVNSIKSDHDKITTGCDLIKIMEDNNIGPDDEYRGHVKQFIQTSSYTAIQRFVSVDDFQTDSTTDMDYISKEGPNGSGKSQSSFAYANQYSSTFPSATIWRIPCSSMESMTISLSILMTNFKIDSGEMCKKRLFAFP